MIMEAASDDGDLAELLRPTVYLHIKNVGDGICQDSSPASVETAMKELRAIVLGIRIIEELEDSILEYVAPNLEQWTLQLHPQPDQYIASELARPFSLNSWLGAFHDMQSGG